MAMHALYELDRQAEGPKPVSYAVCIGVLAWGLAAAAGMFVLMAYSQSAGNQGHPTLARSAGIAVSDEGYTLVMAVHPRCPCTRASVYELERLAVRCRGLLRCRVLVYEPEGGGEGWGSNDPFSLGARLPSAEIQADPGGRIAAALGCEVSGAVVLFDAQGTPQFWGGITPGRGHAGDNRGSDAIASLVLGQSQLVQTSPVYGCGLANVVHREAVPSDKGGMP